MSKWTFLFILVCAIAALQPVAAAQSGPQRFVIVPAESVVTYRVNETLFNEGNRLNTAVGTTSAIKGEIIVDRANPRASRIGTITIDISTFESDSPRRDAAIRRFWLESSRFPTAEFVPVSIAGLPAVYADGQELRLQVTGNLKVRNVVRPNTVFQTTLKLSGTTLTGTATTQVLMTDFSFGPISILGILRTENEVRLEFRLVARP
ncbi:MAG TPA: YceI family protein [bacterium]|jgi:polyisoprenoid-binding protein YceI|nr:YceI family protein [bacterium]